MNLNKNNICYYFLLFFLGMAPLIGQTKKPKDSILTENLDEVVVTATRTVRQLSSLPLPVTLIPKKQLQRSGVTRLDDILNEQTGIVMTPDATIGGGEGVQIQGIASDYVLVLIDGVPVVGRSAGNLDLSRFAIGNIKQIEIVKGPSSSLFGSEALGGVINIITEKPKTEDISGQVGHRSETFNNQNTTVSISQRKGKIGYSLFADRLSTDGFDLAPTQEGQTVNPFFNYTFNGRVFLDVSEQWRFFGSARFFTQEFDVPSGTSEEQDSNAHLRIDHKLSDTSKLEYELYYTNYQTNEQTLDPINNEILLDNDFDQTLIRPELRFNHNFSGTGTLTLGAGYNFENLDRSLFAERVSFDSQYVFAQYDFKPTEKLNLILGARFDNHSVYNSQLSPKLSARYDITSNFAIRGSVGNGFKAPDFRQLFLDFTNAAGGGYAVFGKEVESAAMQRLLDNGEIANLVVAQDQLGDPLDAESSIGYNLGVTYKKGKFSSDVNFFRNDFQNLIDTRILASRTNGQNVFGYINRESVYTQGMEVDFKYRVLENLRISAGYQLLYAFDKQKEEAIANGEVFARNNETLQTVRLTSDDYFGLENRSRHTLNFKTFYEIPAWDANANLRVVYRSRFGLTDRNGNDIIDTLDNAFVDGFALVNLSFGKTFFKHYEVQLGANNLLNFTGNNPLAGMDQELLINPGRLFFARINFQF
ncbi:Putative Outer membrane receptor for transport of vitamin B [Croceitalea dokdonensis DOKDO 023]|uniref:Putative Outer membrane receptor for transport of vitamin B n=1 Tax=Croceitalea dokdonensis DOKDO 023 TaxID=1300341 RepID=A0A0P7B2A6_9FLAO|nr:TonB-dependent receptor [Croceitalea dokdonensis]KPM32333.1 Putative Outer membrane receptor for transport of vitamin B [Croceitalea dokdonensis DOKDO 023]